MDSDRKSNVSSFYGGRKNSYAGLSMETPIASTPRYAAERDPDAASSFFNPDRASRGSMDMLNAGQPNSAGYNSTSYFQAGREEPLRGGRDEEEQAFDVFADFNNAGPRYNKTFGQESYRQLPQGSISKHEDTESNAGPVELVTVPGLGSEWQRSELREMTKAGKREKKAEVRKNKWKQWSRDQQGLCGVKWFTRKYLVYFLFALCIAVGIILAFTIPRVPTFSLNERQPLSNATGSYAKSIPTLFSRFPANFTFAAASSLEVNTGGNYLPLTFNSIWATIFDLDTDRKVGVGYLGHKTVPAKSFPIITIPLNFTYIADNDTDTTWLNWYNACKSRSQYSDGVRPGVDFRLLLEMDIAGLPGHSSTSTQVSGANCPIELPINSA